MTALNLPWLVIAPHRGPVAAFNTAYDAAEFAAIGNARNPGWRVETLETYTPPKGT